MTQPPARPAAARHIAPAWAWALAVLLTYLALTIVDLRAGQWDVTRFIVAGDRFANRSHLDAPIAILPDSAGYDGQFYYRLGLDPFTAEQTAHGIGLDNAATRGARILYPLVAWAVSLGRPLALPWAMLGINLVGLFALAWMGVAIARGRGAPSWLGVLPSLYPGFIVTVIRDTTEVAAMTLSVAAVAFALRGQAWRAAPFAATAVFARETTLLTLAGFGVVELVACVRTRKASAALVAYMIPAVVFAAWQAAVLWHWSLTSFSGTGQNLGPPLIGIAGFFATNVDAVLHPTGLPPGRSTHVFWMQEAVLILASSAIAAYAALRGHAPSELRLSWALYAALTLCLTTAIWVQPYDFLRACTDSFVFGALVVALSGNRPAGFALLALVVPIWLHSAYWL